MRGEQTLQTMRDAMHFKYSGFARALVAAQGQMLPWIGGAVEGADQPGTIAETKIEALPSERVDHVGGVAHQSHSRRDQGARALVTQRESGGFARPG